MYKCDNCQAELHDKDEQEIVCSDPNCPHRYCRYCVPVYCYCGKLIGPDPTTKTKYYEE